MSQRRYAGFAEAHHISMRAVFTTKPDRGDTDFCIRLASAQTRELGGLEDVDGVRDNNDKPHALFEILIHGAEFVAGAAEGPLRSRALATPSVVNGVFCIAGRAAGLLPGTAYAITVRGSAAGPRVAHDYNVVSMAVA